MFDPFAMFNGGNPNVEGMMVMDEVEKQERKKKISTAIDFLHCHKYASIYDACKACKLPYTSLTKEEKSYIKSKAQWAT